MVASSINISGRLALVLALLYFYVLLASSIWYYVLLLVPRYLVPKVSKEEADAAPLFPLLPMPLEAIGTVVRVL